MEVGWVKRKKPAMWAVSQVRTRVSSPSLLKSLLLTLGGGHITVRQLVKPLGTLKGLHTLRICGLSSDSSTLPAPPPHTLRLTEVVLVDVK